MPPPGARWKTQRNWGARIREFDWIGLPALSLENELLRVGILVGKGSDVFEFLYKPHDIDFVSLSPRGFRNPSAASACSGRGTAGVFLDSYPGGWQEVLPSGGAPSDYDGASWGQHGEVSLLPWDYELIEDNESSVAVRLSVACLRSPVRLVKELRLEAGSRRLEVTETLTNESSVSVRVMWGHHMTFGRPFLDAGGVVRLPDGIEGIPHDTALNQSGRRVNTERFEWPRAVSPSSEAVDLSILPPAGAPSDIVYLTNFAKDAWYEVQHGPFGLKVQWDASVMPYLWYWQEFGGTIGYPWYGRHWAIGLEPFSSYPTNGLGEAVANGSALELGAGSQLSFSLSAEVITPG